MVRRRTFLQGVATMGLWATIPARAHAADPVQVLVAGDSMIEGSFGRQLRDHFRAQGLTAEREGRRSTGLARLDFFDWIGNAEELVKAYAPQTSVVMLGGNDAQGLFIGRAGHRFSEGARARPLPDDQKSKAHNRTARWIRFGEDDWAPEYRARVSAFCAVLPEVHWVGMPVMGRERLHARVQTINAIVKGTLHEIPDAHFIDVWPVLATKDGAYAEKLDIDGVPTRIRAHDGIHLSSAGAKRLVDHVAPRVAAAP